MGRKRNPKKVKPWEVIHQVLGEIYSEMKVQPMVREHFRMTYWGTAEQLRKHCIRIINLTERLREENKDGLPAEDRWT